MVLIPIPLVLFMAKISTFPNGKPFGFLIISTDVIEFDVNTGDKRPLSTFSLVAELTTTNSGKEE